ncbi:MAG: efflux RND transporter periplasmic adaptor subunit [Burkholderiaceae bacterium]|nr:efflux RND transporter periplasmic adaptor subunit [Burkholderiaceae bacterium]
MKRWLKWVIAGIFLVVLVLSVMKALSARRAQQEAVAAATAANAKAQTVVELASSDITKARINELSQGLAISGSLKAANSALIKARVAGELQGLTVREGDTVKAGQVVARVDATEYAARLQQAQDQADAAKTQIVIAQRQFDNNKALVDQGFISKTALDTSLATLNSAQASHRATLANVDVAKKAMADTVMRSPLSGLVSQRLAQPGERVSVDARIIEVVDLGRIELEASLSAADSLDVKVGQTALLQIEGSSTPVKSQVVRINPNAQSGSRNVLVYLSLATATGLRQGLFAQGTLGTTKVSALTVPLSTVRTDKPTPYVQVVDNNTVKHRPVELLQRGDVTRDGRTETMVAVKGIAENTMVISGALGTLREGTAIKFTQAAGLPKAASETEAVDAASASAAK